MRSRVPQDLDLEDRLIYGLTPVRFGYLMLAVGAALTCWRLTLVPGVIRVGACALVLAAGSAAAWGRWRGRPLDRLAWDVGVFAFRRWRDRRWRAGRRRRVGPIGDQRWELGPINRLGQPPPPVPPDGRTR